MVTIKQLMKEIGVEHNSVCYGQSRAVLNNLDTEVLAYGTSFAGFIAVWKDKKGYPHAHSYTVKHALSDYPDAGFTEIPLDTALEFIKTNELIAKSKTCTEELNQTIARKQYERPYIGKVKLKTSSTWTPESEYSVERYKNGKYLVKGRWGRVKAIELVQSMNEHEIIKNTIPKEHMENIRGHALAEAL